jgi:hypothetical protein
MNKMKCKLLQLSRSTLKELNIEVSKVASDRFKRYILILNVNRRNSEQDEIQLT